MTESDHTETESDDVELPRDLSMLLPKAVKQGWTVELVHSPRGYNFAIGGATLFEHGFGDWERFNLGDGWDDYLSEVGVIAARAVERGDEPRRPHGAARRACDVQKARHAIERVMDDLGDLQGEVDGGTRGAMESNLQAAHAALGGEIEALYPDEAFDHD